MRHESAWPAEPVQLPRSVGARQVALGRSRHQGPLRRPRSPSKTPGLESLPFLYLHTRLNSYYKLLDLLLNSFLLLVLVDSSLKICRYQTLAYFSYFDV